MVGLHQKDLGQTRYSLTREIRKRNEMGQVATTVLKTSGKVRGNRARAVTSHLAYLLVSEVMPAPLLGCQCFRESEQAAAQEQQTVAEIHCLHHLSSTEYVWRKQMWHRTKQEWQ